MSKILVIAMSFAMVAAMVLGCWWLVWKLWLYVVPGTFPGGPEALIHPGYWQFAGLWLLLGCLANLFRSNKSN